MSIHRQHREQLTMNIMMNREKNYDTEMIACFNRYATHMHANHHILRYNIQRPPCSDIWNWERNS